MKQKIYLCELDRMNGLGNRLKGLFSFIRQYSPEEMILIWPNQGWVTTSFSELFTFENKTIIHEYNDISQINLSLTHVIHPHISWRFWIDKKHDAVTKGISYDPLAKIKKESAADLAFNETPLSIKNAYLPYFQSLKPQPGIQRLIESVNLPFNTVAIQIRNNPDWEKGGRNTNLSAFIKEMKKYPENTPFFLSAMNKETSNYIKHEFPNRIIELPQKNYQSMKHAVADLYLMGKCKKALYSAGSTFGEVSWWLGGCNAEVKVIGEYKNWVELKRRKHSLKLLRIEKYPEKIKIYLGKYKILSTKWPAK